MSHVRFCPRDHVGDRASRAARRANPALAGEGAAAPPCARSLWLAASPFCLVATANAEGNCDVSPKGDPPGFTLVLDDSTVAIPERIGNRRADGFHNILRNPHVGLIYLIPGRNDTLRINGRATLIRDAPWFDQLIVKGHRPQLAVVVAIDTIFFHCAKAFMRSALWQPETGSQTRCRGKVRSLSRCTPAYRGPSRRSKPTTPRAAPRRCTAERGRQSRAIRISTSRSTQRHSSRDRSMETSSSNAAACSGANSNQVRKSNGSPSRARGTGGARRAASTPSHRRCGAIDPRRSRVARSERAATNRSATTPFTRACLLPADLQRALSQGVQRNTPRSRRFNYSNERQRHEKRALLHAGCSRSAHPRAQPRVH